MSPAKLIPTIKNELTLRFFIMFLIIFASYTFLQVYLFNYRLINQTVIGDYPLTYKIILFFQLIQGFWVSFPLKETVFTALTAILTGINLSLLISSIRRIRQNEGNLKMSFGGVGVLALASSGCPSCGITVLSVLGPASGPFSLLLHNIWIQGGIISLMLFSIYYTIVRISQANFCAIPLPINDRVQEMKVKAK